MAKILLRDVAPAAIALVRMGVGAMALVAYLAATGTFHVLASFDAAQVGWALLTGLLLAAYVGTWMTALARARAVDVTSVLVASALVTGLLQAAAGTASLGPAGARPRPGRRRGGRRARRQPPTRDAARRDAVGG